ncbi:T9SS type A sorting domain-containing protein [Spirosoma rhododendri]|uniref:T9SS type A sorting domain-containing protein n=1 Tax=Spirosoma rhododendri TaxID=2728024 RepID=A0A7L5DKB1_9BACT|nr:hypothetical protein [Spirosoma rhododendri]QJD77603.1 hypothetical protein HH216_03600 [Spirosoma rhododendri]
MRSNLLSRILLAGCFLLSGQLVGQSILPTPISDPICLGTSVAVPFTPQGRFAANNVFTVQLRNAYTSEIVLTSASVTASPAQIQVPASLTAYTDAARYQYRIVSSNPAVIGDWQRFGPVQSTASVTLAGSPVPQVNPGQPYDLRFTTVGSSPVSVTLSDGSRYTLTNCCSDSFEQRVKINPQASGTYTIRAVQNSCGLGKSTGTASVSVNAASFKTVSVTPETVCTGGTISVAYAQTGTAFSSGTTFKIRLTTSNPFSQSYTTAGRSYDLDATPVVGGLKATIPASVSADATTAYFVQVVAGDLVSDPGTATVRVSSGITAQITTPSTAINIGQTVPLRLLLTGRGPAEVVLNDSLSVPVSDFGTATNEAMIQVRPLQTTTFRVTRVQSVCGTQVVTGATGPTISVRPGIAIDSLPGSGFVRGPVCEGQSVSLPVRLNFTPTTDTQVFVEFRYGTAGDVIKFTPATVQTGNKLVFTVPELPSDTANFFGRRQYGIRVLTLNPTTASVADPNYVLAVSTTPRPIFAATDRQTTLAKPGTATVRIQRVGGGPYELKLSDGQVLFNNCLDCDDVNATIYASQTKTVRILYAQNGCGRIDNPASGTATLTVQNPATTGIEIDSVEQNKCNSDSIRVFFRTTGLSSQTVVVQATSAGYGAGEGWTTAPIVGRGSGSPLRIKLDDISKIRISGSGQVSNEVRVEVNKKPTAEINYMAPVTAFLFGAEPNTIQPGTAVTLSTIFASGQGPYRTVYTDGTTDYVAPNGGTSVTVTPTQRTTYRLKSISNACGAGTVSGTGITYTPMPFAIKVPAQLTDLYYYSLCAGTTQTIPFIASPAAPAGITYALQLTSRRDSSFTDLTTTTASPFVVTIPASLSTGDYYLRIVAKNTDARTAALLTRISQTPTAVLTSAGSGTTVDAGSAVPLQLALTGSAPWQVQFSDLTMQTFTSAAATYEVRPTAGQTYSIRTVANACGYGTATGSVSVRVKPQLVVANAVSAGKAVCVGSTLPVSLTANGDFATASTVRLALIPQAGGADVALLTVPAASSVMSVSVPAGLSAGSYRLRATTGDGQAETTSQPFALSAPPVYTLSGSTTVNAGGTTFLTLRGPNTNTLTTTYTLSDGYQGSFFTSTGQTGVQVEPLQTTTYTITSISNGCGTGVASGSAVVTVLPATEKTIELTGLGDGFTCSGSSITVLFNTKGSFPTGNTFTLQVSDSTGTTFRNLATAEAVNAIQGTLPADLPAGYGYRLRITSADGTISNTIPSPFTIRTGATATFSAASYTVRSDKVVPLTVNFTGQGPWVYTIQNGSTKQDLQATTSSATIELPFSGTTAFTLTMVSNGCGTGQIGAIPTAQALVITAEEPLVEPAISVYPNPAVDRVQVDLTNWTGGPARLELIDASGRLLSEQTISGASGEVWLNKWPDRLFFLRVSSTRTNFRATYRLLRQAP